MIAFAAVSLAGAPGLDIAVVVTFWIAVVWFLRLTGMSASSAPLRARAWLAISAVVLAYAGGTAALATTTLRVPARAQARDWNYSYGFSDPQPDGAGGEFRWVASQAAELLRVPADARWLQLRINANRPDIAEKPLGVKVWVGGRFVLDSRLDTKAPLTQYVQMGRNVSAALLEASVSSAAQSNAPNDR